MDINSKDLSAKDSIEMLGALTTIDEVTAFIAGDERKTVIDAAEERRKALTPPLPNEDGVKGPVTKQGEQKGPITQTATDFKEGLQRTKGADGAPLKSYVTGEDVIKKMRAAGKKI